MLNLSSFALNMASIQKESIQPGLKKIKYEIDKRG